MCYSTGEVARSFRRAEQRARRAEFMARATALVLVVSLLCAGARPAKGRQEVSAATAYLLVDENGQTRAELSMESGQPALRVFDGEGNARLVLGLDSNGNGIVVVLDEDEQAVAQLSGSNP